jgi:hypothetical protein
VKLDSNEIRVIESKLNRSLNEFNKIDGSDLHNVISRNVYRI